MHAAQIASGYIIVGMSAGVFVEEDRGEHHRRHDRHRVSFEQVGGHAGAIANVVAYVVSDGRRVARIVLRNARFDLAHEVGADVRSLGEDAAAKASEDRDERRAETERDQRVDRISVRDAMAKNASEKAKVASHAEKRETSDEETGHRA